MHLGSFLAPLRQLFGARGLVKNNNESIDVLWGGHVSIQILLGAPVGAQDAQPNTEYSRGMPGQI